MIPLFVHDSHLLRKHGTPRRRAFLERSLTDLRMSLRSRGGDLVLRSGDPVAETMQIAAAHDGPDPLEGFRDGNARAAWEAATIARRRQLVQLLMDAVVILPTLRRGGTVFDPDRIVIGWRPGLE